MCADCEVIISWHSFDHLCLRLPPSPPAEHPHDHRHHPADDPAGSGVDGRNSSFFPHSLPRAGRPGNRGVSPTCGGRFVFRAVVDVPGEEEIRRVPSPAKRGSEREKYHLPGALISAYSGVCGMGVQYICDAEGRKTGVIVQIGRASCRERV